MEGSVAASADFFYIFRASADGNPILRCCSREMGLPSAATLEMYRQPDSSTTFPAASVRPISKKLLCMQLKLKYFSSDFISYCNPF